MQFKKWLYRTIMKLMIKDRYKLNLTGKQKSMLEGLVNAKKMR